MKHINLYKVPPGSLIYHPQCFNTFSSRGEEMVGDLIRGTPEYYNKFNELISLDRQKALLRYCFFEGRKKRIERKKTEGLETKLTKKETSPENKSFFDKNITFHSLVPPLYKRTNAPRLTALGGTLHGMHKDMTKLVLQQASKHLGGTFIDIDLSACHANIASATQNARHSELYKLVHVGGNFWSDNAEIYKQRLNSKGLNIDLKELRGVLKVSFYTSLNGGNPFSTERLLSNLKDNAPTLLNSFTSTQNSLVSPGLKIFQEVVSSFKIIDEVKLLNKECVHPKTKQTFTIDREMPYQTRSIHQGISRVLQGFEVVLLCHLTRAVTDMGGIPVNLAHDGLLVYFHNSVNPTKICQKAAEQIAPWSRYLLQGSEISVEPKSCVENGVDYFKE